MLAKSSIKNGLLTLSACSAGSALGFFIAIFIGAFKGTDIALYIVLSVAFTCIAATSFAIFRSLKNNAKEIKTTLFAMVTASVITIIVTSIAVAILL